MAISNKIHPHWMYGSVLSLSRQSQQARTSEAPSVASISLDVSRCTDSCPALDASLITVNEEHSGWDGREGVEQCRSLLIGAGHNA